MNWDAPAIILIITSITGGLVTLVAAVSAAISANRTTKKADVIIGKTDVIQGLTNGNLSRAVAGLAEANEKIADLKEEMNLLRIRIEDLLKTKT